MPNNEEIISEWGNHLEWGQYRFSQKLTDESLELKLEFEPGLGFAAHAEMLKEMARNGQIVVLKMEEGI